MTLSLKKASTAASAQDIATLEARLGITLPQDYRQFLLETNGGGVLAGGVFRAADDGKVVSRVRQFLGVSEESYESLVQEFDALQGRIPFGVIPIAYDSGGNPQLLNCQGARRGEVYFADLEFLPDDTIRPIEDLCKIANSFSEFLSAVNED